MPRWIRESAHLFSSPLRGCGRCGWVIFLLVFSLPGFADESWADLRSQLRELAGVHGFVIQRLHLVEPEPARGASGDLREQLAALLEGYSYVVSEGAGGRIQRVELLARAEEGLDVPHTGASVHSVTTTRRGSHHQVQAVLTGPSALPLATPLIVDTGASTVVLPTSMIHSLGFSPEKLRSTWAGTANGKVAAKAGRLASVSIDSVVVYDVPVVFIADERLGKNKLLGMSFLSAFRFTIDDANNQIILMAE